MEHYQGFKTFLAKFKVDLVNPPGAVISKKRVCHFLLPLGGAMTMAEY